MKIYLLRHKKTNARWFDSQSDLANFLIGEGEAASQYTVKAIEAEAEGESDGKSILESILKSSERESAIDALTDEYAEKAHALVAMLKELAPKDPRNPGAIRSSAKRAIESLTVCEKTKESFSKAVKKNLEYLLYSVSSSTKWYSAILEVYPIKKLSETCRMESVHPLSKGIFESCCRTPEKMVKAFEKALEAQKTKK